MAESNIWTGSHLEIVAATSSIGIISALLYKFYPAFFCIWCGIFGGLSGWAIFSFDITSDYLINKANSFLSTTKARSDSVIKQKSENVYPAVDLNLSTTDRPSCGDRVNQPWEGLTIPAKVNTALEEFLNMVLNKFIYTWYRNISDDETVVTELRRGLKYVVCELFVRAKKVDLASFVNEEFIPAVTAHLIQHSASGCAASKQWDFPFMKRCSEPKNYLNSRTSELDYIKYLCDSLLPHLLPFKHYNCRVLRLLIEQILAGIILLPVADKISDPDIVNYLIVLLLDQEPPPTNADAPTELVDILTNFIPPNEDDNRSLSHYDLGSVLSDQEFLQSFISFLTNQGATRYLQFFLELENFKKKILETDKDSVKALEARCDDVRRMCEYFVKPSGKDYVHLSKDWSSQFLKLESEGVDGLRQLLFQCEFISRTYDHLYTLIDGHFLPLYKRSLALYAFVYGSNKIEPKRAIRCESLNRRSRASSGKSKLAKDKLSVCSSGSSKDLRDSEESSRPSTPDNLSLKEEEVSSQTAEDLHDISRWIVEIPNITVLPDDSLKCFYSFKISVKRTSPVDGPPNRASVYRTYKDFYLLEQKLKQFHGDKIKKQLPAKKIFTTKDQGYLDSVKHIYEDFLKEVILIEELKNSELLYRFLTVENFSKINASEIRIDKVLKSMPWRLSKEKGQNLNLFLQSFLNSTVAKPTRPNWSQVEGCKSSSDPLIIQHLKNPLYAVSSLDNKAMELSSPDSSYHNGDIRSHGSKLILEKTSAYIDHNENLSQCTAERSSMAFLECISFLVEKFYDVPKWMVYSLHTANLLFGKLVNSIFSWYVQTKINNTLEEHRIERLVHLLRDALFFDDSVRSDKDREMRKDKALNDIKSLFPVSAEVYFDSHSTKDLFDVLQDPKLNKQMFYTLMDLVILKIFPEITSG